MHDHADEFLKSYRKLVSGEYQSDQKEAMQRDGPADAEDAVLSGRRLAILNSAMDAIE